ncbi:hypothetical protein LCGC14_2495410 [marine sediment metagenome]|uniref:Uncharacterized protein n=1 Tax=marine sediment metagenome TaxID=412755 RepID=A0A0F8VBS3_9ZZZZ
MENPHQRRGNGFAVHRLHWGDVTVRCERHGCIQDFTFKLDCYERLCETKRPQCRTRSRQAPVRFAWAVTIRIGTIPITQSTDGNHLCLFLRELLPWPTDARRVQYLLTDKTTLKRAALFLNLACWWQWPVGRGFKGRNVLYFSHIENFGEIRIIGSVKHQLHHSYELFLRNGNIAIIRNFWYIISNSTRGMVLGKIFP